MSYLSGFGQGGTRPGWLATWSQRRTPEQQRGAAGTYAGDYRADTTLVWAVPGRAPAGCRSVNVTAGGLRLLQDLRRLFATYDKRLLDAAQAAGLPIDTPG